jgi:glutamate-ammonia-ligase adenylyltransferase
VGDAYRLMRKLQHQQRLQGKDNARVDPARVAPRVEKVLALWAQLFQ